MKSKLQVKKEIEREINQYYENKVKVSELSSKGKGITYKEHDWDYWHFCHTVAETKLEQIKEDTKDELSFLEKLRNILNKYHSEIPFVEVGRQNVLNDIDNELNLDKRIKQLKEVLK